MLNIESIQSNRLPLHFQGYLCRQDFLFSWTKICLVTLLSFDRQSWQNFTKVLNPTKPQLKSHPEVLTSRPKPACQILPESSLKFSNSLKKREFREANFLNFICWPRFGCQCKICCLLDKGNPSCYYPVWSDVLPTVFFQRGNVLRWYP